eukprot:15434261-Alexandrium_andersonii.AAC.1
MRTSRAEPAVERAPAAKQASDKSWSEGPGRTWAVQEAAPRGGGRQHVDRPPGARVAANGHRGEARLLEGGLPLGREGLA